MNPIVFFIVTFGLWIVVKGRTSQYWDLATTKGGTSVIPSTSRGGKPGTLSPLPPLPKL